VSYERTTEINEFGVSQQMVVLFWVELPSRLQQLIEEITAAVENITKNTGCNGGKFQNIFLYKDQQLCFYKL
jgi:hypothetical protein